MYIYLVVINLYVRMYLQGSGGGMATGPVVPEEHHVRAVRQGRRRQQRRRQVLAGGGSWRWCGVREGELGRRAVPAQGGPQDVQELPGAVQGAREDVQLLHHWYTHTLNNY